MDIFAYCFVLFCAFSSGFVLSAILISKAEGNNE